MERFIKGIYQSLTSLSKKLTESKNPKLKKMGKGVKKIEERFTEKFDLEKKSRKKK